MNEASKQLHALLVRVGNAQEIATACGVAQPVVVAWANGLQKPDPLCKALLEQDYKIPSTAWK